MALPPDWTNAFRKPTFEGANVDSMASGHEWGSFIENGPCSFTSNVGGVPLVPYTTVVEAMETAQGRRVQQTLPSKSSPNPTVFFKWEHTVVALYQFNATVDYRIASNNKEEFDRLFKILSDAVAEPSCAGRTYILSSSSNGIVISDLGATNVPLVRENYCEEVLAGYDHVITDLDSDGPCGRVILLDGIAGSGKTHILYGMMAEVSDAMFLYVPAGLVAQLVTPDFMSVLIRERDDSSRSGPIIIVVEDADSCLVSRQADNMNSISALLNIGEGVLGRLLDIRIVATTNAKDTDIDSALIRPGRLCKKIGVGKLTHDHANTILSRLAGKKVTGTWSKSGASLAEVYKSARDNHGWTPEPTVTSKKKRRRGFRALLDD